MIIVMMPNSWGKGKTFTEAEKIARSEGGHGRKKVGRIAYYYDENMTPQCYVDGMGHLCWQGDKPVEIDRVKP